MSDLTEDTLKDVDENLINNKEDISERKTHRKRKKKILSEIQQLLEFYFGDANLRHARYLRQRIEDNEEGYVDVQDLLSFNKLKALSTNHEQIVIAVDNSALLELNDEHDKVRRVTPLPEMSDADDRTVYVEHLCAYVTQDWLREVFSTCGRVEYISLPRFAHNKRIKGFAFIEFSSREEAERSCQVLHSSQPGKKEVKPDTGEAEVKAENDLQSVNEPAQHNDSPKRKRRRRSSSTSEYRSAGEGEELVLKKKTKSSETDDSTIIANISKPDLSQPDLTQSTTDNVHLNTDNVHLNTDNVHLNTDNVQLNTDSSSIRDEKEASNTLNTTEATTSSHVVVTSNLAKLKPQTEDATMETIDTNKPTNTNKRKRRRKQKKKKPKEEEEVKEKRADNLFVITKHEYTRLKREYKTLQRKGMSELKIDLKKLKSLKAWEKEFKTIRNNTNGDTTNRAVNETTSERTSQANTVEHVRPQMDNKCEQTRSEVDIKTTVAASRDLVIESGTVLALRCADSNVDRTLIRTCLQSFDVAYVDYNDDGTLDGHVRFSSSDKARAASEASNTESSWKFSLTCLTEADEQAYTQKAQADKEKKLNSKQNKKKKKNKILRQVENALNSNAYISNGDNETNSKTSPSSELLTAGTNSGHIRFDND